jgi:ribose transport system substrate-binding protein
VCTATQHDNLSSSDSAGGPTLQEENTVKARINPTRASRFLVAVAAVGALAACSTDSGTDTTASDEASTEPAADCPLATAEDPGNSEPPKNVPMAMNAPKLESAENLKVGFSQNASDNPWRLAETASLKAEAKERGHDLTVTDAGGSQEKQIADIKSLIQQDVDALFIAPITEQLSSVVNEAADADIPVILLDRAVDEKSKPGEDFVTVISSDFVQEGKRAAVAMARATGGTAKIIELEGTTGSSPAIDRKAGFTEAIKACPGMEIVESQDADFNRATGQQVAETLLGAHPDANAVYAHNDEMALGAIAAIEGMGKVPGEDIMVVSIDGSKDALTAVDQGKMYATIECNPKFGPIAFDTLESYAKGEEVPTKLVQEDLFYDESNAAEYIDTAY